MTTFVEILANCSQPISQYWPEESAMKRTIVGVLSGKCRSRLPVRTARQSPACSHHSPPNPTCSYLSSSVLSICLHHKPFSPASRAVLVAHPFAWLTQVQSAQPGYLVWLGKIHSVLQLTTAPQHARPRLTGIVAPICSFCQHIAHLHQNVLDLFAVDRGDRDGTLIGSLGLLSLVWRSLKYLDRPVKATLKPNTSDGHRGSEMHPSRRFCLTVDSQH